MLARARRVDCTWVWLVFSNRSLASKMSWGLTPYLVMALMKLPMFSSWRGKGAVKPGARQGVVLRGCGEGLKGLRVWAHLVPILCGFIDLLHGAWLELIDEPARRKGEE